MVEMTSKKMVSDYGHNMATHSLDYIIIITVKIRFKYSAACAGNIYIHAYFEKLPNMVSLTTKWTPPLNSY